MRRYHRSEEQIHSAFGGTNAFPLRLDFDSPSISSRCDLEDILQDEVGESCVFENPDYPDTGQVESRSIAAQSRDAVVFALRQSDEKIRMLKSSLRRMQGQVC